MASTWLSGYHLAKLILISGSQAGHCAQVPFVVRAGAGNRASVLVVAAVNTWQAYDSWGRLSLYSSPRSAVVVSFDRPYATSDGQLGLGYPVARFIDQFGYDIAYTTDIDADADPRELRRHRLVVIHRHSEYWTSRGTSG